MTEKRSRKNPDRLKEEKKTLNTGGQEIQASVASTLSHQMMHFQMLEKEG